jgi:hypothetical protein
MKKGSWAVIIAPVMQALCQQASIHLDVWAHLTIKITGKSSDSQRTANRSV